jgi:hypothetical protein
MMSLLSRATISRLSPTNSRAPSSKTLYIGGYNLCEKRGTISHWRSKGFQKYFPLFTQNPCQHLMVVSISPIVSRSRSTGAPPQCGHFS